LYLENRRLTFAEKILNDMNDKKIAFEKTDILPIFIWVFVIFITWTFMHSANDYLKLTKEALGKYYNFKWILIAHITTGGGALILGIIQFWKKLRVYSWKLHRIVGFLYLLSIIVSSFCAMILAFTTAKVLSLSYAFSLQIWASVWISTTALAYYFIVKKKFKLHEEWMIRSYIVTMAFVISGLILKFPFMKFLDLPSFFWFGWAIPLYIYEIIRSINQSKII
jgi:hypothetical protein